MSKEKERQLFKMRLQFFADPGDPGDPGTGEPGSGDGKKEYTDKELQRMMATEKNQGRLAVYRELGFEFDEKGIKNGKDAKAVIEKFKQWNEGRKDEFDKAQEKAGKYESVVSENQMLRNKLDAVSMGVKPECLDDVVALASIKVTDDLKFKDAVEELKEKYPTFFVEEKGKGKKKGKKEDDEDIEDNDEEEDDDEELDDKKKKSKGTGSSASGAKGKHESMSTGARLAQQNARTSTKSNFFKR